MGEGHEAFIDDQFAGAEYPWRICSWHKNMESMQVGSKGDSTGWGVYAACRRAGALIATGHEHSYSRTKTLIDMDSQSVDPASLVK